MLVKLLTVLTITLYSIFSRKEVYLLSYCVFFGHGIRINPALLNGTHASLNPLEVLMALYRQDGVLSPILFTVYLDELLQWLTSLDIGCHVGHHYVGLLCYANDIAPSPSALRALLMECELFAIEHNLLFNVAKTQLIYFCPSPNWVKFAGKFLFSGHLLEFSDSVTHLGHVIHCSLDDSADIRRATLEMCKKATVLSLFVIHMSRQFSSAVTVCCCMVVFFGILHAINLKLWRLHLIIFSGISAGFQKTVTLKIIAL